MGSSDKLVASAVLSPMSHRSWMAWMLLAVVTQLSWGLYGVCTRYLQTKAAEPMSTLQLGVMINAISWPGLIVFCTIPNIVKQWLAARQNKQQPGSIELQQDSATAHPAKSIDDLEAQTVNQCNTVTVTVNNRPPSNISSSDTSAACTSSSSSASWRNWLCAWGVALGLGAVIAMQALTNIYACQFTSAYLVQLLFMSCPLFTAIANKFILRQPAPNKLWLTLALTIAGSAMVIIGNWLDSNQGTTMLLPGSGGSAASSGNESAASLVIGSSLAVASSLLLSAFLVLQQITRHIVTDEQVLWSVRYVAVLLFVPLSLAVDGTKWSWLCSLGMLDWAVLVFTGLFIYTINSMWLQYCCRKLGAAVVSIFISLRLVASVLGSLVLLQEVPTHILTWVGFAVVLSVMTGFMLLQYKQQGTKARTSFNPKSLEPQVELPRTNSAA